MTGHDPIFRRGDQNRLEGACVSFPLEDSYRGWRNLIPEAEAVLRLNDMGGWTRASPTLYPHQWSWDSAFIAIGLARVDVRRAARELETLFMGQWRDGKVPHIVFDPHAPPGSYFPGPEHWATAAESPDAPPRPTRTSSLCQPPVHAIAVRHILEIAREIGGEDLAYIHRFVDAMYSKLLSWHRYLATKRDPEGSGLVTIYHPWESGTDNSPRWDEALDAVPVGEVPHYRRGDLQHVDDAAERPTDLEYDRYLWLVELVKRARYDEAEIYFSHPFLVKDVLFSAILVAANEALLEIADFVDARDDERAEISSWIQRGRAGLDGCWDEKLGLCLDHDIRRDAPLRVRTSAGFAPLIAGALDPARLEAILGTLRSEDFLGNLELRWTLPPSTSPREPRFHPRSYWRGPVWPVINWLLWWSLERAAERGLAAHIREESLHQLAGGGLAEYFEPLTGEPLGSGDQSWTAAVALEWLARHD